MKNLVLLLFIVIKGFYAGNSYAQLNFVRNGSFEQKDTCPWDDDQIKLAKYWSCIDTGYVSALGSTYGNPDCTPEYINTCASGLLVSAPVNGHFYQYPRTGNGMAQVQMYSDESTPLLTVYQRDYLQGLLSATLIAGRSYCVTFYVVSENYYCYAINNIGAYLDDGSIDTTANCGLPQTEYTPQILETSIISDTLNWTKIQGSFIANGTERFITIGNFFDTAHTAHVSGLNRVGEYLVDDVSVIPTGTSAYAGPDRYVGTGDTTYVGVDSNGDGMPCYWYLLGGATPIDSGGTLTVRVLGTQTYIVSMDLCGTVTYDTVTVHDTGCAGIPVALYTYTASPVYVGTDVLFTYAGHGPIDSVRWNFGDGGTATTFSPTHVFASSPDSFNVCLMIYGPCGEDTFCHWVHNVPCPNPLASFTDTGVHTVGFTYTGPITDLDSMVWSFGDGDTSTMLNPVHTYTATGEYQVCVRVYTSCDSDSVCHTVSILCLTPPVASFSDTGTHTVGFTYTGTTVGMDSVRWSFGDGGMSTATNPVHTYTSTSTYYVCVIAYSGCGSDSACGEIEIALGIPLLRASGSVQVWPNPAKNQLTVIGITSNVNYRLLNITGVRLQQGTFHAGINTISIQDYSPGVYVLEMTGQDGERNMARVVKE